MQYPYYEKTSVLRLCYYIIASIYEIILSFFSCMLVSILLDPFELLLSVQGNSQFWSGASHLESGFSKWKNAESIDEQGLASKVWRST